MAKTISYLEQIEGRLITLDTETTGFYPEQGDKIVEIGAVEIIDGKRGELFHQYINPERHIPEETTEIHGITDDQVEHERKFYQMAEEFLHFVNGSTVVIHNAEFDVKFINEELKIASRRLNKDLGKIEDYCEVVDSLSMARKLMPGKKADLDSLCKRLSVDNSNRDLHGALIDSEILADVYGGLLHYQKSNPIKEVEKPYEDELVVKPLRLNKRPKTVNSLSL